MLDATTRAGRAPLLALATAAAVVALTATAPQADAAFVIDDFSLPDPSVALPELDFGSGPVPSTFDSVTTSGVGDGSADRTVSTTSLGFDTTGLGGGSLTFNNGFGSDQSTFVSYAFTIQDFTSFGDRIQFDWSSVDILDNNSSVNSLSVPVTLFDADANSNTQDFDVLREGFTEPGPTTEFVELSAYSGIDLTRITGVEFVLDIANGSGAPDLGLDSVAVVPLPGALPLFLGGLAGVGYVVRRRQRQAAAA